MCTQQRNPIYCIIPPHLLRHLAQSEDPKLRELALRTLSVDATVRLARATTSSDSVPANLQALAAGTAPAPKRSIYDNQHQASLVRNLVRTEGQPPVADQAVNQAFDGLGATFDFYWTIFRRNSIDNAGLPMDAYVHFQTGYDNAFWDGHEMVFGDGNGIIFTEFTGALDVIGHELTHGVTGNEANLKYLGQSGALNESISDVFGSMIKQYALKQTTATADWLIGKGILAKDINGVALRSMKAPGTAYDDPKLGGKDPQPANMANYLQTTQDNGGVHINSGIPNLAFYLVAAALGGNSWDEAGVIWYDTIRDKSLTSTATFSDFGRLTWKNAGHRYGSTSPQAQAVKDAWNQVGVVF